MPGGGQAGRNIGRGVAGQRDSCAAARDIRIRIGFGNSVTENEQPALAGADRNPERPVHCRKGGGEGVCDRDAEQCDAGSRGIALRDRDRVAQPRKTAGADGDGHRVNFRFCLLKTGLQQRRQNFGQAGSGVGDPSDENRSVRLQHRNPGARAGSVDGEQATRCFAQARTAASSKVSFGRRS